MKADLTGAEQKKELPRKRGAGRFFEVLFGSFRDLIKLNLLFCCCALPSAAAFILGFFGVLTGYMYLAAFLASFPVGGALTSYVFCITKMLRDEPGYIWYDFKRKFLENFRQAAAPGMLSAAFAYAQIFMWGPNLIEETATDIIRVIIGIVTLQIFGMVAPYIFLQIAYIDIKTSKILKNSLLVSFMNAPRSFLGACTGGAIWVAFLFLLPDSLLAAPLLALIGIPISLLLCLIWVWPPVDKQFKIDETLRERRDKDK